jgi:antitoxin PrlF
MAEFESFATHIRLLYHLPYINVRKVIQENAMATATLTTKGQITIPVEVRASLGVDAGDRVEFVEVAPGRYEFIAATRSVTALKGMFGKPRKGVSIDDMNAAIARRGAAAK